MKKETKLTYRELIKEFIAFLKKNNALESYKKEMKKQHPERFTCWYDHINPFLTTPINGIIKHGCIGDIIDVSFTWSQTKKGFEFWRDLNDIWRSKTENMELIQ